MIKSAPDRLSRAAFLDISSVHCDDINLRPLNAVVPYWSWYSNATKTEITEALPDAEILVSNKIPLGEAEFSQAPKLKLVCIAATGVNTIDLQAAKQHGITVCNVNSYATPSVVQHVFSLLLALVTRLKENLSAVHKGDWSKSPYFCLLDYPVGELQGKTMGIVGYGELGQAVARVAEAFGMHVLIAKRNKQDDREGRVTLDVLLTQADVLTLHCPLTAENATMIGEKELAMMKPEAILINTARGGLIDEVALLAALQNNTITAAAIDVLEVEPPESDQMLINANLANLIITPHVAWVSRESRQRLINGIAKNIEAYNTGEAINVVTS